MPITTVRRPRSVARELLLLQLAVLAVVVVLATGLAMWNEHRNSDADAAARVTSVSETLADTDTLVTALRTPDPSAVLQPQTERIREQTGVDFLVVMAPDRTRYTHTDPALIGGKFTGHIERALDGHTFTETYAGSLGPSVRTVTPVYDDGEIIGLVSAGVTREKIGDQFRDTLPAIFAIAGAGLLLSAVSAWLVSRRLRRQTLGLAPADLRRLYEHHDAVLHSLGEGLVVLDRRDNTGYAGVVNDEARRLLDLPDGPVRIDSLPPSLRNADAPDAHDEVHLTDTRVLVVNRGPVDWEGSRIGTVLTIRDHTELQDVLGELDSVRGFAESLRTQTHESANRLHTIVTMVELGRYDDAIAFATSELASSQHLVDRLTTSVTEPALSALLLGKVSYAAERGVDLTITEDTALTRPMPLAPRELVTLVGNLIDNAIDVARTSDDRWVEVSVREEGSVVTVSVADSGPGMTAEELKRASTRGFSTKSKQRGLGLALVSQVLERHGGTLRTEVSLGGMLIAEVPLAESGETR